eukprot:TRINITY_DN3195_c0_g3_i1.p1 TRINITY_DN3195_c0_g3~~TRINITY_DN3195_c0_g3_i1.p1  ORF type:complete len:106 (+),score=1.87 TRINITY_DN3195_c0_g3_i1:579-896(+)
MVAANARTSLHGSDPILNQLVLLADCAVHHRQKREQLWSDWILIAVFYYNYCGIMCLCTSLLLRAVLHQPSLRQPEVSTNMQAKVNDNSNRKRKNGGKRSYSRVH